MIHFIEYFVLGFILYLFLHNIYLNIFSSKIIEGNDAKVVNATNTGKSICAAYIRGNCNILQGNSGGDGALGKISTIEHPTFCKSKENHVIKAHMKGDCMSASNDVKFTSKDTKMSSVITASSKYAQKFLTPKQQKTMPTSLSGIYKFFFTSASSN